MVWKKLAYLILILFITMWHKVFEEIYAVIFFISRRERNAKQRCKNLHWCYDVSHVRLATWAAANNGLTSRYLTWHAKCSAKWFWRRLKWDWMYLIITGVFFAWACATADLSNSTRTVTETVLYSHRNRIVHFESLLEIEMVVGT